MPPESTLLMIHPLGMRFSYEEMAFACGHTLIHHIVPCRKGTGVSYGANVGEAFKSYNLFARGCMKVAECKVIVNRQCLPEIDLASFGPVFYHAFSYAFSFDLR